SSRIAWSRLALGCGMHSSDDADDSFVALLAKVIASGTPQLAIGAVLGGRFRIERVLGFGGMGTVYVARDRQLARDVAIKLHHITAGATRLAREAVAMAQLAHPNVVTVFETGVVDGRAFVVM